MRKALAAAALILSLTVAGAGQAQTPAPAGDSDAIKSVLTSFGGAMDKGDMAGLTALHTPTASIFDEFAPFTWSGEGALGHWVADFFKSIAPAGITGVRTQLGQTEAVHIAADRAYATAPVTLVMSTKDAKTITTYGQFAFLLVKADGAWKIDHWTYTRTGTAQ
jgi:ketosteroid isomerase-like protein